MHLVFKETILDKLVDMIKTAKKAKAEIDYIVMTSDELDSIFELHRMGHTHPDIMNMGIVTHRTADYYKPLSSPSYELEIVICGIVCNYQLVIEKKDKL